jgi:copper homeostasis protein
MNPIIEICVEGIDGALAAAQAGADRIELCASLVEGGITPSLSTIRHAREMLQIPVHVIIRPRGGDFLYSPSELGTMADDVKACAQIGVAGVVFGCLLPDGTIDEDTMSALVVAADEMAVTCHRAFDMTRDPDEAIEALVRCGVDRVLTSGQRDTAVEGMAILQRTVKAAAGRIKVMACGALDETNIRNVLLQSGADELHFAALMDTDSLMAYRNPNVGMGGTDLDREYRVTLTDPDAVRRIIAAARG